MAKASVSRTPLYRSIRAMMSLGVAPKFGAAAMPLELEFLTMRAHRRHDGFRRCLAALERRGGEDAAHDHPRVHVPGLRLKTDLDGDAFFARLREQAVEFAQRPHGNGQVGSRKASSTRGPWPQTSGSACHAACVM